MLVEILGNRTVTKRSVGRWILRHAGRSVSTVRGRTPLYKSAETCYSKLSVYPHGAERAGCESSLSGSNPFHFFDGTLRREDAASSQERKPERPAYEDSTKL